MGRRSDRKVSGKSYGGGRLWITVGLAGAAIWSIAPGCTALPILQDITQTGLISAGQSNTNGTAAGSTPSVNASLLEQLSLERINRARLRPASEAANNGIAVDEGAPGKLNTIPKQALALNIFLNQSARGHSQDMLGRNYFAHDTPEGVSPFERMTNAGFVFAAAGENLAWRGTTGALDELQAVELEHTDLFVDSSVLGRGHRLTMLNASFREVGIGTVRGRFEDNGQSFDSIMQTQDYGTTPANQMFVLGVVYDDTNQNGQYDFGEGVANSTVTLGDTSHTTNAGGGYSFAITEDGAYTIRFASNQTYSVELSAGGPNLKVDMVDGSHVVVNLGLGPLQ